MMLANQMPPLWRERWFPLLAQRREAKEAKEGMEKAMEVVWRSRIDRRLLNLC
jgi:hypothetical protein